MHFYYIDESGDTGEDLDEPNQQIVVLGGISVRDEGWNKTHQLLQEKLISFLGGPLPPEFELHATDLLSPNGDGAFQGYSMQKRCELCRSVLDILEQRSHSVHYVALDKRKLAARTPVALGGLSLGSPYLFAFDYLVTFINWHVKEKLGKSARGMIFLDRKDEFHTGVEKILRERRFGGSAAHRVKWVVEFSYPIDSKKNPMIQISDLVVYCVKRFIEVDQGLRNNWGQEVKDFYAACYSKIRSRLARATSVLREERSAGHLNDHLEATRVEARKQWRKYYQAT